VSSEDILLWPDGYWCFASDLDDHAHRSDDFERIPVDSPRWDEVVAT
jgi:hypothetical protein